jgi:hypothetical protein
VFIRPDAPSGSLLQVRAAKGVAKIITPARFVNVLVMVKGYRPQSIEALSQDIEVRLAGPITVLLELNNGSAIPAGYIMRLRIQPKDLGAPFDQRYSSTRGGNPFAFNYSSMSHEVSQASEVMTLESPMVNWGGGGGGTLANLALKQSSITLKAGKGSFETAAAGRFTITATIVKASKSRRRARTRAQSVQLDPAQIDVLDAGNQSFKLTVNAKSLAAALAKIAEAANKSSETSKPR